MQLYYYCSYDGSPAGFCIGYTDFPTNAKDLLELQSGKANFLIRKCFESGYIRSAFGRIPESNDTEEKFFLLTKKISDNKKNQKDGSCFYLNIALISNCWEDFEKLMITRDDEQELASAILESIAIDRTNSFGFRVDPQKLYETAAILCTEFSCYCKTYGDRVKNNEAFFLISAFEKSSDEENSTNDGIKNRLLEQLGISEPIKQEKQNLYSCEKKKPTNLKPIVIVLTITATLILMINLETVPEEQLPNQEALLEILKALLDIIQEKIKTVPESIMMVLDAILMNLVENLKSFLENLKTILNQI